VLKRAGYLKAAEASKLTGALKRILESVKNGSFRPENGSEDIHTDIQNKLGRIAGGLALKLHTARSRNEQVALATRMYCRDKLKDVRGALSELIKTIAALAGRNDIAMPGFTHMQHAQVVRLKDYLGAYVEMLGRDDERLAAIAGKIRLEMGAGALAGTPIASGFYQNRGLCIAAARNSLDAVSDRDFVIEALAALSMIGMHLSRIAEDLIIWSTKEFGFADVGEGYCTGSSLMPQKKNPDSLELIRGSCGRLYGNLVSVLTVMKGLPLTYNRDMQLDKEPLFDSMETVLKELMILAGIMRTLKFNKARIEECLEDESLYATDLVYYLVGKGVPFSLAHSIVGKLVRYSQDNSIEIKSMTARELARFSGKLVHEDIVKLFNPLVSVRSKRSIRRGRP
jgi:argininosuccinate lyase